MNAPRSDPDATPYTHLLVVRAGYRRAGGWFSLSI